MITKEITINGKKEIIVVKIPEELKEDYIETELDDTIDLSETVQKLSGDTNE